MVSKSKSIGLILGILWGGTSLAQTYTTQELWLMPSEDYVTENTHQITARDWDFEVRVLDRVESQIYQDSIETHNQQLWASLESKGIAEAEKKYYQEFEKEKKQIQQAAQLSENHEFINGIYGKLKRQGRLSQTVIQKMTYTEYRFMIYSFDRLGKKKTEIRFIVDLRDGQIRLFK